VFKIHKAQLSSKTNSKQSRYASLLPVHKRVTADLQCHQSYVAHCSWDMYTIPAATKVPSVSQHYAAYSSNAAFCPPVSIPIGSEWTLLYKIPYASRCWSNVKPLTNSVFIPGDPVYLPTWKHSETHSSANTAAAYTTFRLTHGLYIDNDQSFNAVQGNESGLLPMWQWQQKVWDTVGTHIALPLWFEASVCLGIRKGILSLASRTGIEDHMPQEAARIVTGCQEQL